jgi:hypothetical protein
MFYKSFNPIMLFLEQIRQAEIIWYIGRVQLNINPQSEGLLVIAGEQKLTCTSSYDPNCSILGSGALHNPDMSVFLNKCTTMK